MNLSSDKEQEYFSDGLTEELLNLLAKVPGLRVASRTSAFAFKGKNAKMSEIGRELGVGTVLEGSVRKSGDQVRITTQLISAADGYHLWSETYDRKITDVFAVQDEIAVAVVKALKLKLLAHPGAQARRTGSVEAHDLYLRGLYFWNLRTIDSLTRAAEFFRAAIRADPEYALAHVGVADALRLDPTSRIINTNAGDVAVAAHDYPRARALYQAALDLAPDFECARSSLAILYALEGKQAEAEAEARKVSPAGENRQTIPIVLALTGRRQEAERLARELEALSREQYVPAAVLADVWAALGDRDKTFAALRLACREKEGAWGRYVKVDPVYDGIRSDPRFGEILDCMNLR